MVEWPGGQMVMCCILCPNGVRDVPWEANDFGESDDETDEEEKAEEGAEDGAARDIEAVVRFARDEDHAERAGDAFEQEIAFAFFRRELIGADKEGFGMLDEEPAKGGEDDGGGENVEGE